MAQLDLFEEPEDIFLKEAEAFLLEMECKTEKQEETERFFERNHAFEWAEEFPQICDTKGNFEGFDVVIGNPPYVDIRHIEKKYKDYYNDLYPNQKNRFDLYTLFIEKGLLILKKQGYLTYIVPRPLLYNSTFSATREQIFAKNDIKIKVIDDLVFKRASVENMIFSLQNSNLEQKTFCLDYKNKLIQSPITKDLKAGLPVILANQKELAILKKLKKHEKLSNYVDIMRGLELGKQTLKRYSKSVKNTVALFSGEAMDKYSFDEKKLYYVKQSKVKKYLKTKDKKFLNYPRILLRRVANKPMATIIKEGEDFINNLNAVYNLCPKQNSKIDNKYLIAILNSNLASFFIQKVFSSDEKIFPYIRIEQIKSLPFKVVSEAFQKPIISKVNEILTLKQENPKADTSELEQEIDGLVYKLYDLSEAEIKIIEDGTTRFV